MGSLRGTSGRVELRVAPGSVEFKDVQAGVSQSMLVTIKNTGRRTYTLRWRPNKSKYFTVHGLKSGLPLAAGLETQIEVVFEGGKLDVVKEFIQDRLLIQTEDGDFELTLKAIFPKSDVQILGDLNFGVIPVDSKANKKFQLVNNGFAAANYKIEYEKAGNFTIAPASGTIPAVNSGQPSLVEISASVTVADPGALTGEATITVDERDVRKVTYSATVVKHGFEVLDSSGIILSEVDFGPTYYDEAVERKFQIFNNGPIEARYVINFGTASEMKARADEEAQGEDPDDPYASIIMATRQKVKSRATNDNPFLINPMNGKIPPYSKGTITVRFAPKNVAMSKGFATTEPTSDASTRLYDFMALLEFVGVPGKVKLPVKGRGMPGGLRLSPASLVFGDVPSNQWADQLLQLINTNSVLDAHFTVEKASPYYECQPKSGVVMAGQTAQLVVRYHPKALGKHPAKLPIKVMAKGSGMQVQELALAVSGTCLRAAPKPLLVGGVDKLPKDFEKPSRFIDDEQVVQSKLAATKRSSKAGVPMWEKPQLVDAFKDVGQGTQYAMSKEEFIAVKAHKDKYTTGIRAGREAKEKAHLYKRVDEGDVNLGLDTRSGLLPFEPHLPKDVDPLWTVSANESPKPKAQRVINDRELEAIPFCKDRPETDMERYQCSRELSRDDIGRLVVGPKVVDFGSVSVGSTVTQHLVVHNTLDAFIHVVLDIKQHTDLRASTNTSQVIPPLSKAKFPIVLTAHDVHSFNDRIEYCVNGTHILGFNVSANIVPVSVELSSDQLHFEFNLDNWDNYVDKVVVLDNPNKFPVEFSIEGSNSTFAATPLSGTIKPLSSSEVLVRWAPPLDGSVTGTQDAALQVRLVGGDAPKKIFLQALLPEGNLRLKEKAVDVGAVPVGVPQSTTVQLKNAGARDAAFRVMSNEHVKVSPSRERVAPDDQQDLEISWTCLEAGTLSTTIEIQVRGGKTIKLPFRAEGVVPAAEVVQDEFSFGSVYLGSTNKLPLTLSNTLPVPCKLVVDLTANPEFTLAIAKDAWSPKEYEDCPLQAVGPVEGQALGSRGSSLAGSRRGSRRVSSAIGNPQASSDGFKFHIQINPKSELPLQLVYRPSEVKQHAFELCMLTLTNGVGQPVAIRKVVTAEALQPRLIISKTIIDFGTQIVIRSNQVKAPYGTDLYLTNHDSQPVQVDFGEASTNSQDGGSGVFVLNPRSVMVQPQEMVQVSLLFTPRDAKLYEATMPVYLDGNLASTYLLLELQGTGQYPRLSFDMRECVLPPVPLGVRSQSTFHIVNNGYDNLELRFRLPADESHLPMQVDFPEGTLIGIAKERLPVVVSFMSSKPISFTANIDFMDEDGKRYSMPVTGTTDNCTLTNQAFMDLNAQQLLLEYSDGSPINLDLKGPYDLPDARAVLGPEHGLINMSRFLNATTTKGPFDNMARQMQATRGKLLVELLEALSGKSMPGKVGKLSSNKKDAAEQLVAQYDAALVFLKAHGALLNAVKPEMLLDFDDFCRILNARSNAVTKPEELEALDMWAEAENNFDAVSAGAWNSTVQQAFKVFVLGRVTLKGFKSLPGIDPVTLPPDSSILGSNIYSVAESVLLSWMSIYFAREFPNKAHRVTNFDDDLKSGLVIFSLLAGYWPGVSRKKSSLRLNASDLQDYQDNADVLLKILGELGLPYEITSQELSEPNPREMMVFVLYLYQTLPQFVPRTAIEFNCRLGETQSKDLELTNPSKKAISYTAKLDGHKDFSIEGSIVRIDPRGAVRLPIKCVPSTSVPQEARLVLMSRRDGGAHAATLVFLLQSRVNTRAPLKRVRTEGPLYEMQQFEFTVSNPFPSDGEFTITLIHEPAEPLPKKEPVDEKKGRRGSPGRGRGAGKKEEAPPPEPPKPKIYPDAFGLDRNRVRLKFGASDKLKGFFLPFIMGQHYCTIMFKDKDQGEFCYEVVGETALPAPIAEVKGMVPLEGPCVYDLQLGYANPQLDQARRMFQDKHPLAKDKQQLALLKQDEFKSAESLAYQVSQTNTLVTCDSAITLINRPTSPGPMETPGSPQGPRPPLSEGQINNLHLTLKPIGTGIYPTRVLLTSQYDTRVVDVELTAQTMTQTYSLEFECAVRTAAVQDIPLVNASDQPMTVQALLTGKGFTGLREVTVAPGSTVAYRLDFRPVSTGDHKGSLELSIPATGERNVYNLLGRALEPVAESHIVIECQARKGNHRSFNVPNITGSPVEYKVLCDLDFVTGPEALRVAPNTAATYKIVANPQRSGKYLGSITFMTSDNQFVWYSLEVRASEPPEVGRINVASQVRSAVAITVSISNPTSKALEFVARYSDDSLLGPPAVLLPPSTEPYSFEFFYAPLMPGDKDASLTLVNDEVGEFWYGLRLHADPAPPETLPDMSAELGRSVATSIPLENPLPRPATVTASSSNPDNFTVAPAMVSLEPYGSAEFVIEYRPSSLATPEAGSVLLSSPDIGEWRYECRGQGLMPTAMETTTINAVLGSSGQQLLTWRNPFRDPVNITVQLASSSSSSGGSSVSPPGPEAAGLELLLRRDAPINVAGNGVLQLPVSFSPQNIRTSTADVLLTAQPSGLTWRFPLKGVAEVSDIGRGHVFRYKTKARSEMEEVMEIVLTGLTFVAPEDEFTHEVVIPHEHKAHLEHALRITPLDTRISSPQQPLKYAVHFEPRAMFTADIDFFVHKSTGGRWKFEVQLQACEPDLDGIITIEAAMGQLSSRPVPLYSGGAEPQAFTATLTTDTPLAFNVIPAKGLLPPRPAPGEPEPEAPLVVTYTCRDFGKVLKGKLFVNTTDMQYSYELRGKMPNYVPPTPDDFQPSVDDRLATELATKLRHEAGGKNHVVRNIKATRNMLRY